MSKELPYFRFTVAEWMNGDISFEDDNIKGVFADIIALYWFKDCSVTKAKLKQRFSNKQRELDILFENDIIKESEDSDYIKIIFLDEQYDTLSGLRKSRQEAGRKGGLRTQSKAKAKTKQSSSYKDKDNNKDKDKIKKKHSFENSPYYDYEKFKKELPEWSDSKIKKYYDSAVNYSGANGGKYLNWVLAVKNWERKDLKETSNINVYEGNVKEEYGF